MSLLDAALERIDAALDLGNHARSDDAFLNQLARLILFERAEQGALFVFHAFHVGHENQLLGMQRLGDFAGDKIRIDIVSLALFADAHGGDDGNKFILVQRFDHQGIDAYDLADHADVDDFRGFTVRRGDGHVHLLCQDQAAVLAAQADRHAAMLIDQGNDGFVDLADQNHFDDVECFLIGDPHAADVAAGDAHLVEHRVDLRPAAVDDHRIDPDVFQQDDVLGEARFELLVFHRMAAVFDNERLAVETLEIGQRLHQDLGLADKVIHVRPQLSLAARHKTRIAGCSKRSQRRGARRSISGGVLLYVDAQSVECNEAYESFSAACPLEDIARQVFVHQDRLQPLAHVGGIDGHLLAAHLRRRKGNIIEQTLEDRMEAARADVFGPLVHVRGDQRDLLDRVFGKLKMHAFGFKQGFILCDQGILGLGQDAHEVLFAQRAQLDANRESSLKLGNQVRWLGRVKSTRSDKKNMVGFDHAVFGVDGRAFDDRQEIPLHALARHIGALHRLAAGDFVDLVEKDDARLLDPAHRFAGHLVHIDQATRFFLGQDFHGFGNLYRLLFGFLGQHVGKHFFQIEFHAFHTLGRQDFDHRHRRLGDLDVDETIVQLAFAEHALELLPGGLQPRRVHRLAIGFSPGASR